MIILSSSIQRVTVYTDRAQIYRIASAKPGKGTFELVFDDLPASIDASQVQVRGKGDFFILNVQVVDVEKKTEIPKELLTLKEELKKLADEERKNIHRVQRLQDEIAFIKGVQTKLISGDELSEHAFNPDNWKKVMELHRQQLKALDLEIDECDELAAKNKLQQKEILDTIATRGLNADGKPVVVKQVKLLTEVNKDEEITLVVSYLQQNASWIPQYDLRITSEDSMLNIAYYGVITQNTGEDWVDVEIQLSTARPAVQGAPPTINAWRVYPRIHEEYDETPMPKGMAMTGSIDKMMMDTIMTKQEEVSKPMATAKSGVSSVVFEIGGKSTIKKGNQNFRTTIALKSVACDFNYRIFPARSPFAFLSIKFKNDTDFPLLAGNASVFTDGNYTSKTSLRQIIPGQEIDLSLGIDEGIVVEHKHIKTYEKNEGVFQKRIKIVDDSQVSIHNTKKNTFLFTIIEAIPLSQHQDIHIELITPTAKEKYEHSRDDQGILTRKVNIPGGEKMVLPLSFSIDYPKNMDVDGLPYAD